MTSNILSVVLPTLHNPESLLNLFDSLSAQTCLPTQFICVFQGYSKKEIAYFEAYLARLDMQLTLFDYPDAIGLPAAKLVGLRASQSKYTCFLEDDLILDKYFFSNLTFFLSHNNPTGVSGVLTNTSSNIFSLMLSRMVFFGPLSHDRRLMIYNSLPKLYDSSRTFSSSVLSGGISAWDTKSALSTIDASYTQFHYFEDVYFSLKMLPPGELFTVLPFCKAVHDCSPIKRSPHSSYIRRYTREVLDLCIGSHLLFPYRVSTLLILFLRLFLLCLYLCIKGFTLKPFLDMLSVVITFLRSDY